MKKTYIVAAAIVLIILIIISIVLSLQPKSSLSNPANAPFPTSIPLGGVDHVSPQITSSLPNDVNGNSTNLPINLSSIPPMETADFRFQYSGQLNKLVVERKTSSADQAFNDWAAQNNYPQLVNNPDKVAFFDYGSSPVVFNPVIDFLNIFLNMSQGNISPSTSTTSTTTSSSNNSVGSISTKSTSEKVYFAQCGDEGNTPLPDGGTLCSAGCGPTSAAMIASSYVSKQYDPKAIVDLYQKNNYLLGSDGSRYQDAHSLLSSLGLKTTDYFIFNSEKADSVVPQLRSYINAGWTFFTLAYFCDGACGHYFWITGVDSQGDIMAYDPAYGRYQIPYNENSRYPFPLYLQAFGVKK